MKKHSPPVLAVEELALGYGDDPVLTGINFSLGPGEFLAVAGPNGCGKTTLVKAVLKLIRLKEGCIRIQGREIRQMSHREMARATAAVRQTIDPAAMTLQEYVLLGRLPFYERFRFFETQKDLDLATRYMSRTGIAHLARDRITEVSGGERQLAAIARALVQTPALLVLDEPTSHLDISHQVMVLDLITQLKQELDLAVLVVLHDLNLAAEYADRILLLDREQKTMAGLGRPVDVLTKGAVQQAYQARVEVLPNPITQNPWIFPIKNSVGETDD